MQLEELLKLDEKALKLELEELRAHDIAALLNEASEDERGRIYALLEPELLADALAYRDPIDAAEDLADFDLDTQKEIINQMQPDDAADIISELDKDIQEELLSQLDDEEELRELLEYEKMQAGAYMTNKMIVVDSQSTVKEATRQVIKEASDVESIATIFVVDKASLYQGQVTLKKLIKAAKDELIETIMDKEPTFLDTDSIDDLIRHLRQYGAYEVGIVNQAGKLVGHITTDDILDIYEDSSVEDYEKLAALPETDSEEPVLKAALSRMPWLLALLILSIPIALVTQAYEEIIASVVILAMFQPLILDAGGDVASQTLAVTLISIHESDKSSIKNGIKEVISGVITGAVLSIIAFLITLGFAYISKSAHPIELSLVVSLGLLVTVIIGPMIGFLVPVILHKCKIDPAIASGPFITTLIDILSLVVYFGFATIILGGVIHV